MKTAESIMRRFNPNGLIGEDEQGHVCMIEDVTDDPDNVGTARIYRLEYVSTPDGKHAVAFCRSNPWGSVNGGESYAVGHVNSEGFLCLGSGHYGQSVETSPYDLTYVIKRARFWSVGFSCLKEGRPFPNL